MGRQRNFASRRRTALLLDHPFFGSLLFRLKGQECRSIPTMATDGVSLYYNPEFVDTQNSATLAGVLAHEVMYPALHHHVRRSERDSRRWNEACDYAINPLLLDAGLRLPDGILVDNRFREMSAEQIYNQLETEAQQESGDEDAANSSTGCGAGDAPPVKGKSESELDEPSAPVTEGGIGQVLDAPLPDQGTPGIEEQGKEWSVAVNQAVMLAKQAGKVPAGIGRTL
jgi:predicted metal-dependent peptidase